MQLLFKSFAQSLQKVGNKALCKNTHMEHAIQVEPDERKCGRKEEGNATISVNHCTPAGW